MNSEIEKAINTLQYELDGIPSDIDKSEFEQAVTLAIKALQIVKIVDTGFINDVGAMIEQLDWEDIKSEVDMYI